MKQTPTVRFNLKTPSTVNSLILAKISYGYKTSIQGDHNKQAYYGRTTDKYNQVIITTGITIPTAFFDRENQCINGSLAENYNPKLEQFKKDVRLIYESLLKDGKEISPAYFKDRIKKVMFHVPVTSPGIKPVLRNTAPSNITEYVHYKINKWKESAPKSDYRNYTRFIDWVKRFEDHKTKQKLDSIPFKLNFETLEDYDIDEFVAWQIRQKIESKDGTSKNYRVSYLNKIKDGFKQFVEEARKDRIKINPELNLKIDSLKKVSEEADDIYLNEEYLDKIRKVVFPSDSNPKLELIRDLILVHCACGFRVEDFLLYQHLTKEDGKFYFQIRSEKTDEFIKIPVYEKEVLSIYKKYGNKFPTEQTYVNEYNKLVKDVCLKSGLIDNITVRFLNPITRKQDKIVKKVFTMVSAKTFRKTFASRMVRKYNAPVIVVMSFTGHRTEGAFRKYIRLQPAEYTLIAGNQMRNFIGSSH